MNCRLNDEHQQHFEQLLAAAERSRQQGAASATGPARSAAATATAAGASRRQPPEHSQQLEDALREDAERKRRTAGYLKLQPVRQGLPAWSKRQDILAALQRSQVLVVEGATGCGKTTQVPQFVLDAALETGQAASCNIICTQPRRISAIAVAQRVASERGEPCGGQDSSTGYIIRLESRLPRSAGSITFCTVGILLRRLLGGDDLRDISHVIVDEIHERDVMSDFALVLLRDLLPRRPDLKVVYRD